MRALLVLAMLLVAAAAPLQPYEARTIVTGTDTRSRPAGMAACLTDVLIKVSGDPSLLDDKRVAALAAARLVAGFDYRDRMSGQPLHDEQGSSDRPYDLTVRFDPAGIDAALRDLGRTPWLGPRPTVMPVQLTVRGDMARLLTADDAASAEQIRAWRAAADRTGLTLRVPTVAQLAAGQPATEVLAVTGSLTWSEPAHGWVADWSATWQGEPHHWSVSGVSFDEAFRVAMRGALAVASGHAPR